MSHKYVGKYWFHDNLPDEVLQSCEDLFVTNEYLIPEWCNQVKVKWESEGLKVRDEEAAAYVETSYAYRSAAVYICPAFLSQLELTREVTIKHELWHIVTYPLIEYVRDMADIVAKDDETLKEIIDQQLTEKMESVTEDLTNILNKIESKNKKK